MDSDTGGKSKHDFSDIMSMLGEEKGPETAVARKSEPVRPRDDAFVKKLLADIEHKNAEILKLNSDNVTLKYAVSEKEMEIKRLRTDLERKNTEILKLNPDNMALKNVVSEKEMEIDRLQAQSESLRGQAESLRSQVAGLNRQIEDMNKFVQDARIKLGEMDADRAKLTARIVKDEPAPPAEEEDVASIFKRIALKGEEGREGEGSEATPKKQGTAKLYDL